ncbi:hypothetical protein [Actinomycetospora cinnamomea]|uniref:Uncharacterized protein n=1 Tax=Actinomycetospora cinnamomea TaxID=663609 RepID=A0A2U1FQD0_9PSEU|nr:hypothetical protein [Actinomycetospora cinnamomea]PVZ14280.1 hypothetical protein C8D89_101144 [Actinomycetospora cinnamomea]
MTFPAPAVRHGVPRPAGPLPWRTLAPERAGEITATLAPARASRRGRAEPAPAEELPDLPVRRRDEVRAFVAAHRPRLMRLGLHLVVAALPLLAISAHVFGVAFMHVTAGVVVVPLTLVVLLLALFAPVPEDRLVRAGVGWGVVATLVYDAVRLDTVYLLGLWGDFIPTVGTWILDVDAGSSTAGALVGYVWRYVGDGGGIGVAFFVLVAATGLRRWGRRATVAASVVFAVFPVWTGLVATVAVAPRGEQQMFPLTVTTVSLSLLGHLVFGLVLGLGCARCRRLEEYWPWTPLLDLRRRGRPTGVSVATRSSADEGWGPPALVAGRRRGRDGDPELTEIRVERPVRRPGAASRDGTSGPASRPVRVVGVASGPLPVPGAPSGPLPVPDPRAGARRDPRSGPLPVAGAARSPGTPGRVGAAPGGPSSGRVPVPVSGPVPPCSSRPWSRPVPPGAADPWLGHGRDRSASSAKAHPGAVAPH